MGRRRRSRSNSSSRDKKKKRRHKDKERDKDRKRDKDKDRSRDRDRDTDKDRTRDRNRDKDRNRTRDRDERSRDRDQDYEQDKRHNTDRNKHQDRDRNRRQDRDRDQDRNRDRDRNNNRRREADSSRDRNRDRDRDRRDNRRYRSSPVRCAEEPTTVVVFIPETARRMLYNIEDVSPTLGLGDMAHGVKCPWFHHNRMDSCRLQTACPYIHLKRNARILRVLKRERPATHCFPDIMTWDGSFPPKHPCEYQYGSCNFGKGCKWESYHGHTCAQWLKKGGTCPRMDRDGDCGWAHSVVAGDGHWVEVDDESFESDLEEDEDDREGNEKTMEYPSQTHSLIMKNTPPSMTHGDFVQMWEEVTGFHSAHLLPPDSGVVNFTSPECAVNALLETNGCHINVCFYGADTQMELAIMMQQQARR